MTIILFSRKRNNVCCNDIESIFNAIKKYGFNYVINQEFAEVAIKKVGIEVDAKNIYSTVVPQMKDGAVMVCYGGDGTILEGVHSLAGKHVPLVGINSGHLGFLSTAPREKISHVFEDIAQSCLRIQQRSLLELSIAGGNEEPFRALNEVSVQRLGASLIEIEARINGELVTNYWGDGLIVATPTGSTAYSLSAGGPIVDPSCNVIIITPLAPHNLSSRPIVVPFNSRIELVIKTRSNRALVSADTHTIEIENNTKIAICRSNDTILLAQSQDDSFYATLKQKMKWGIEIR
ncbi:MAG: NAD(+)/NADH kinase [Alistipes sp.]|nr:NAD(+)/NADH kinase [Candidatus Alistipes equi]